MPIGPEFSDVDLQLKNMDEHGIDNRVLSLANPWFDCFSASDAIKLSRKVNQAISQMVESHIDRFFGLAALPMHHPTSAAELFRTSVKDLGLRGAIIGSNLRGERIDQEKYWDVYEEAAKLGVPIFVHPTEPRDVIDTNHFALMPAMAFPFESTVAAVNLIYSRVFLKYPRLKVFVPHLGGVLPYIIGRIDHGYYTSREAQDTIPKPPSYFVRRNFYSDCITFSEESLACGLSVFETNHLVMGTDYPFPWGDIKSSLELLKSQRLDEETIERIRYKNAFEILSVRKLPRRESQV